MLTAIKLNLQNPDMNKKILRPFADKDGNRIGYHFWCEGCESYHGVWTEQENPHTNATWSFNNDLIKPTFSPSILIRSGHYSSLHKGDCWCDYNKNHPNEKKSFSCGICHSFIRDGNIQYLNDCTHRLKGQTVPLKPDPN